VPICDCGHPHSIIVHTPNSPPIVHNGRDALVISGPTTLVEVGFDPGLFETDPTKVRAAVNNLNASTAPNASFRMIPALIDTGATESCVDETLANELQLPLIDRVNSVAGIGGQHELNVYLGHLRIVQLGFIQYGRFIGAKLRAGGQMHQALLGRTLLKQMVLNYDGRTGAVTLSC
jgi:predicted aspartyl protease